MGSMTSYTSASRAGSGVAFAWVRQSCLGAPPGSDDALLTSIEKLPGACIVVSKGPKKHRETGAFARLRELNKTTNGIELRALSGLGHKAPKIAGKPMVMGPYDVVDRDIRLPTFRTIGYRKIKENVPIAHAKLALLGNICWTDEDPIGGVTDYVWFSPKRLWVSSANFTYSSRRSLEFGYWTEDAELMGGVQNFVISLIGVSEDLDTPADTPDPELATVELDHARRETAEIEAELNGEELDDEDW
jgi:hypothetical protein